MEILKFDGEIPDSVIARAVETLRAGGIIAYPTETYYGLGAKFDIEASLSRLFELKGRPSEKAVPLIVGEVKGLFTLVETVSETATALIDKYWPGPLTVLFPARRGLSEYITSRGKVAVRMPGESFALHLARVAGFPITATSANPADAPPPIDIETVIKYFPEIDLIIDGGRTPGGPPSTIIDVEGNSVRVIREGAIKV